MSELENFDKKDSSVEEVENYQAGKEIVTEENTVEEIPVEDTPQVEETEKAENTSVEKVVSEVVETSTKKVSTEEHAGAERIGNPIDDIPVEEEPVEKSKKVEISKEEIVEKEKNSEEKNFLKDKIHFSFEARVTTMILSILFLFIGACILILGVVRNSKGRVITYQEKNDIQYEICLLPGTSSSRECLGEEKEYSAEKTDIIHSKFYYHAEFSESIPQEISYYIKAYLKIYDSKSVHDVIYKTEDLLFEQTKASNIDKEFLIDAEVNVNYQKYYEKVLEYQTDDPEEKLVAADLEIVFYLNDKNGAKKISSLLIPLGSSSYRIVKNVVPEMDGSVKITGNFWNQYTITCAVVASILIIICLILLYRTTQLILKVTTIHNKYRQKLWKILREYDRIIVIARGGYESNFEREIVKVESFEQLLEIKQNLQKPIIYSRVNDVKSEFIVEDEDKIYKFVLKESDV